MRERYFIFLMLIYLFFLSYWTIDLAKAEFQVGLSAILNLLFILFLERLSPIKPRIFFFKKFFLLLLLLFWMRKSYIFLPIEFVIHIRVTFFN